MLSRLSAARVDIPPRSPRQGMYEKKQIDHVTRRMPRHLRRTAVSTRGLGRNSPTDSTYEKGREKFLERIFYSSPFLVCLQYRADWLATTRVEKD